MKKYICMLPVEAWQIPKNNSELAEPPPQWVLTALVTGLLVPYDGNTLALIVGKEGSYLVEEGDYLLYDEETHLIGPCKRAEFERDYKLVESKPE